MARPNLERFPGGEDAQAVKTLRRTPEVVDGLFLRTVDRKAQIALGRYGARVPSLALRSHSPEMLRDGVLAAAISAAASGDDDRDVMVGLALHFDCAQRLGVAPEKMFNEVAERIGDPRVGELLRTFGSRADVTLQAFGWTLVETTTGLDFEPTTPS